MSQDAVRTLIEQAETDAELRGELDRALGGKQPVNDFLAIASERGFDFTAQDVIDVLEADDDSELDDAALDAVAGGAGSFRTFSKVKLKVFRSYASGPRIGQIGPGFGGLQEAEEEDLQT